jgi:hypothetical protein
MEAICYVEDPKIVCEVCKEEITISASRERRGNHKEAVYGHCTNPKCTKRGEEVCYLGACVNPVKERPSHERKREIVREIMHAPRMLVGAMGRQQRIAHAGARV